MIKLNYSKEIDEEIIRHENHMLGIYVKQLQKYIVLFEEKGYDLKIGLMWKNFFTEAIEYERPNFVNGYECYVYCVVESNGEEVCVKSVDGEADYYSLSTTWMISSIVRRLLALKVLLYSDVEGADSDVFELFGRLMGEEDEDWYFSYDAIKHAVVANGAEVHFLYLDNDYWIAHSCKGISHLSDSLGNTQEFNSTQELFEHARINGKRLEEIWDEVIIDAC